MLLNRRPVLGDDAEDHVVVVDEEDELALAAVEHGGHLQDEVLDLLDGCHSIDSRKSSPKTSQESSVQFSEIAMWLVTPLKTQFLAPLGPRNLYRFEFLGARKLHIVWACLPKILLLPNWLDIGFLCRANWERARPWACTPIQYVVFWLQETHRNPNFPPLQKIQEEHFNSPLHWNVAGSVLEEMRHFYRTLWTTLQNIVSNQLNGVPAACRRGVC